MMKFTKREYEIYNEQANKSNFDSPLCEYSLYSSITTKKCSKCSIEKTLDQFSGNTSSSDHFDKNGYRLRRPECKECSKKVASGKNLAKKKAKQLGIDKPPYGSICAICYKEPRLGNDLVFDHCHKTDTFRGWCCNSCNRSIGVLGDDIDGVLKVLNYLLKSKPTKIVQNSETNQLVVI
tara:strand:+ start:243 stop:779 length:537 start_codon:yes stop_codon:yes gene_type:complete